MSDKRTLGDIDGIKEGTTFKTRKELSESGLHRPTIAGISGSKNEGDDSIVVSGGYEDDEDNWDSLLYTG